MADRATDTSIEQVGGFELTTARAEDTPESKVRWDGRVDDLAGWLLREWENQQRLPYKNMSDEKHDTGKERA